jgi:hypothetical protein
MIRQIIYMVFLIVFVLASNADAQRPRIVKKMQISPDGTLLTMTGEKISTAGIPGPQGLKGDTGERGLPGERGLQGEQGIQGYPGNDGAPGTKGDKGDPGIQGEPGIPGTTSWGGITDKPVAFPAETHDHDSLYEAKNSNIQTHVLSVHAPANAQKNSDITKGEIEAKLTGEISTHTHAGGSGGLGYALRLVSASQSTTTDSQTVYWGGMAVAPSTTANRWRTYIPKAGTIKAAYIFSYAGTAGTNENWTMNIRLNNSSDTLIQTLAANTNDRVWSNTNLNISVAAGNYIEIKEVFPAWATNPATVTRNGVIYIE